MDPETGSNMGAIDPSPPTEVESPATQDAPQDSSNETPIESTEASQDASSNLTPAGRVQDILNAFNKEKNAPPDALKTPPTEATSERASDGTLLPNQPAKRSYDGLDDNEIRLFKRMHNDVYNHMYPAYKEYKGLKGELEKTRADLAKLQGQTFYDHEEAYAVTPEYKQMTGTLSRIQQEGEYWQQALAAVEAGGKWQDVSYDPETGKYIVGEPQDASPQAKALLIDRLTRCHALQGKLSSDIQAFQGSYKGRYQGYVSNMMATRDKVLEGVDANMRKELEKAAVKKLDIFPLEVRGRPEVKIASELMVINEGLLNLLVEKESQLAGRKIVTRTAQNAGPVNAGGAAPANGNTVGSAIDAFRQAGFRH